MALSAWQATIVNESGDVIPSASIEVTNEATGLTATIYANSGGGSLGNPFPAGTNGFARFYADAGSYTITASDAGSGFSESFNNVRLGNAQGYDVGSGAGEIPRNSDLPTFGTAAQVDTGTAAGEVPTNADLGTAAQADTGTAPGNVPTNNDLGPIITGGAYMTAGGTANSITLTSPSGYTLASLTTGMQFRFRAPSANTTTTTVNIDGLGAVTCKTITGVDLPADYIRTDVDTVATYDGTNLVLDRVVERGSSTGYKWCIEADGSLEMSGFSVFTSLSMTINRGGGIYANTSPDGSVIMPKSFTGTTSDYSAIASVGSASFTSNSGITGIYQVERESANELRITIGSTISHTEPSIGVSWAASGYWY